MVTVRFLPEDTEAEMRMGYWVSLRNSYSGPPQETVASMPGVM